MTDRSHPDHPELDALSEWLDGLGAAATASHVDHCRACQARVADLGRARDAVAQPVPPLPEGRREQAIRAALAAVDEWTGGEREEAAEVAEPLPLPRVTASRAANRARWWLGGSAAAAVLMVVVASVALLGRGTTTTGTDTALSAGPESGRQAELAPTAGDTAVSAGDLGDVASVEDLRARVAASVPQRGMSAVQPAPGGGTVAAGETATGGAAPALPPVPNVVGTRVCEVEARTLRPQLGVVVYAANLRYQGTPAVVLGFAPTPGVPPATLLVLAPQEGCRLLLETGPS